jgi:hypothetical protein
MGRHQPCAHEHGSRGTGVLSTPPAGGSSARTGHARAGTDRTGRYAALLRKAEQGPSGLRINAHLHSQQIPVAGMLRPAHARPDAQFHRLSPGRWQNAQVVARYQQFRAVHKAVTAYRKVTRTQGAGAMSVAALSTHRAREEFQHGLPGT